MNKRKKTNRQIQAENTKNKIYKISLELLDKKGFENLKISDICKKANVSIGSFYNYYKSKSDILNDIFKRADTYFEETVSKNLESVNYVEKIILYFEYYGKYNEIVGLDTIRQLYKFNDNLFIKKGRYMQDLLIKILKEGQEKGEIVKTKTPEEICNYLFISARGVSYDWCIHDGKYNIVEALKDYISQLILIFKVNKS